VKRLLAIALLVSACGAPTPTGRTQAPGSSAPSTEHATTSPAAAESTRSDTGYLPGLTATTFQAEAAARDLSCETYPSDEQRDQQVWWCEGDATDGSELFMSAQGPDLDSLEFATAEVLGNGPVEDEIVIEFLGPMSKLYAGADGGAAQSWLTASLPAAQRDGSAEKDVGAYHLRLTFDDHGPGTPSATYLLVTSAFGPPAPPADGPLPSEPGAAYFGEVRGVPGGWVPFLDPDGAFNVAFPVTPVVGDPVAATGSDGLIQTRLYGSTSLDDRTTLYYVIVEDYDKGALTNEEPSGVLDAAAERYLGDFDVDPADRLTTEFAGHPTLDVIQTSANLTTCLRLVAVADRLYTLAGLATHRCPADMAGFVGSFVVKS
jgi:hypothetical protein